MISAILAILFTWLLVIGLILIGRNFATLRFLNELLEQVHIASTVSANRGEDWHWRIQELDSVSYERLLFSFWEPLQPEYFWEDLSFLDHQAKEPKNNFKEIK